MIGVLLGVESSKQPWSTEAGRVRDARSLVLALSWGSTKTKGTHSEEMAKGPPEKQTRVGVL